MKNIHLSLVLVEHPTAFLSDTSYHWSNIKTVHELRFFEGMIEITFSDGTIEYFNQEETTKMLESSASLVRAILNLLEIRANN